MGLPHDPLVTRYMYHRGKGSQPVYKTPMSTRPPRRSAPAVASMLVVFALIAYGGWFWLTTHSLPVSDIAETDTKTAALLSTDPEATVISGGSSIPPVDMDLVTDNPDDKVEISAVASSTEKTAGPSGAGIEMSRIQVTDEPATELALNEKAALGPDVTDSLAVQTKIPGQVKTDLTSGEAQILSQQEAETLSRGLPDELVKTQMLTDRNTASLDLLNSGAIADLRDPTKEITIRAVVGLKLSVTMVKVLAKLMQVGDSYVVDSNSRLFLSTGNAGGLTVVIGTDTPLSMGAIGEIVRDLPLVTDKLRKLL